MRTGAFTDYQSNVVGHIWIEGGAQTDPDFLNQRWRLSTQPSREQFTYTGQLETAGATVLRLQRHVDPPRFGSGQWTRDPMKWVSRQQLYLQPESAPGFVVWVNPVGATTADSRLPAVRGYVGVSTLRESLHVWPQKLESPISSLENAESEERLRRIVDHGLSSLFQFADELPLEDAIESEFSRLLELLVKAYGSLAVEEIDRLINSNETSDDTAWHALRWLGRMHHGPSYQDRLKAVENSLRSQRAVLRDGAALSLASIDDPHAAPYLELAIAVEPDYDLRQDMITILEQLRKDRRTHADGDSRYAQPA